MRLYERMMKDGVDVQRFPRDANPVTTDAKPVDIRVTADQPMANFWGSPDDVPWQKSEFGVVRPPFPVMWIEGNFPDRAYADGVWKNTRGHQRGFMVQERNSWVHMMEVMWAPPLMARPVVLPLSFAFQYDDDDGTISTQPGLDDRHYIAAVQSFTVRGGPPDAWSEFVDENRDYLIHEADVPLYALSLMNCKNVKLKQDEPPSAARQRAHLKRHGVPISRFSRIVLPSQRNSTTTGHGGKVASAQHLVRGHFKTYTAEAPLMGRHVGTYWWGWHARGDEANGKVHPTYEVAS